MVIHIVPMGRETGYIFQGLNDFEGKVSKLILLHSPNSKERKFDKFETISKKVEKEAIRRYNCKTRRVKIDFKDLDDIIGNVLKIIDEELSLNDELLLNDFAVNITGGTKLLAVGAMIAAMLRRVKVYYVYNKEMEPGKDQYTIILPLPNYKENLRIGKQLKTVLSAINDSKYHWAGISFQSNENPSMHSSFDATWKAAKTISNSTTHSKLLQKLKMEKIKKGGLSYSLNQLEEKGLIKRTRGLPASRTAFGKRIGNRREYFIDKKATLISITDHGKRFLKHDLII